LRRIERNIVTLGDAMLPIWRARQKPPGGQRGRRRRREISFLFCAAPTIM
jgi:hypothetical protein